MALHDDKDAMVADMGEWTETGWRWMWNSRGINFVFPVVADSSTELVLHVFLDFLQGVQLATTEEDRWVWLIDLPRGFTVKSCYQWMCNRVMQDTPHGDDRVTRLCNGWWKGDLPSKVLVFGWRLMWHKLPVKEKLLNRGIIPSYQAAVCVLCNNEVETTEHLFCNCGVVKEVWNGVFSWLNVQGVCHEDVLSMYESLGDTIKSKGAKRVKFIFWAATVYQIWLARNGVIFDNKVVGVTSIVNSIKFVSWGWFIARRGRESGFSYSDWFSCPLGCISSL